MPNEKRQRLAIGMDVGSTTVKAVVVDPATKEILWSDYQRHHTKQPEYVPRLLETILGGLPRSPDRRLADLPDRLRVARPLCAPTGGKFVQEVNAVTLAVEHLHPDVGSVIELGGQDAKIIMFKKDEKTGDKTADASMNDKCASRHGRHHRQVLRSRSDAPPELVTSLHFDDSKLHHVAAKCGVFAETDIVNLIKSGIPATEVLCSLADAIVLQNLSRAHARGDAQAPRAAPRRPEHVPAVPAGVLAPPHPADLGRARLRLPEGHAASKSSSSSRRTRSTTRPSAPCSTGCTRPSDVGVYGRPRRARASTSRPAARRASARPPGRRSSKTADRARRLQASSTRSPSSCRRASSRARWCAASSGSTAAPRRARRCSSTTRAGDILCKAYQLSKGNPIQDTKELLDAAAGLRRGRTRRPSSRSWASAPPATRPTCSRSACERREHRRDGRAHDERRALLRRRRRHLRHRRAGHQGPLHEERRHRQLPPVELAARPATACSCRRRPTSSACPVHRVRRRGLQGRARAEVQLRLRGLPRHRSRQLPERGLLEGGDARRPGAGAAEERLAVRRADPAARRARDASSSCRAARSTTSRPSRRRSTTSRSASPAREVFVHPHTGEAGAIGAAMETLRVVKRRGKSTFIGIDAAIDLEYTSKNDEETVCHFCPNNCKRTFIDTTPPRRDRPAATSPASPARRAPSRARRRCCRSSTSARRSPSSSRTSSTTKPKRAFMHFYDTAPMPAEGAPIEDVDDQARASSACGASTTTRPFRRSSQGGAGTRGAKVRIGIPRVLNLYSTGPVLPDVLRGARHPEARTSSSATRRPRRCGSRAASTARSTRASRARSRRRTSTTCSSTSTPRRSRSSTSSSPSSRTCPTGSSTRWTTRAAPSSPARRT